MKTLVIQNVNTSEIGIAVRVKFFDDIILEEPLANMGGHSLVLRDETSFDGYIVQSDIDQPFIFVEKYLMDDAPIEFIGEL